MPESKQKNLKRLGREQPIEITAEFPVNYPNLKKIDEKENIVNSEINKSQLHFVKRRFIAALFQMLTTGMVSKELRICNQKVFQTAKFSL